MKVNYYRKLLMNFEGQFESGLQICEKKTTKATEFAFICY